MIYLFWKARRGPYAMLEYVDASTVNLTDIAYQADVLDLDVIISNSCPLVS